MSEPDALGRLVRQVVSQGRWRRVEHYGMRGAFYGALAAVVPLVVKGPLASWAIPLGAALVIAGALAGALVGATKRIAPVDAARLADRAFGLADRVTTALECAARPDRGPMADALIADTM